MAKLFCISDIHGFYDEMRKALDEAGFDPNNKDHWLICCGDTLDRGRQPRQVISYLMKLSQKVLVKGNHEDIIMDCIAREYPYGHDWSNGTAQTIIDLAPNASTFDEACTTIYWKVARFVDSMVNYFETKNPVLEASHKIIALQSKSVRGGTTFSCNVVNAGKLSNVVADECKFTIDVRVCRRADMSAADLLVREICEKSFIGDTVTNVERLGMRPPMEPSDDTYELFARLAKIGQEYGIEKLSPISSGGGSDSAYTQAFGITSLCGLGGCGDHCHSEREYIEIPSIARRAKLLAALLLEGEDR